MRDFSYFRCTLKVKGVYEISWFWGAALRGRLGYYFKRRMCVQHNSSCQNCFAKTTCPFFNFFVAKDKRWRIIPPCKQSLQEGEFFSFDILLFDHNTSFSIHFIQALRQIFVKDGLVLKMVEDLNNDHKIIYNDDTLLAQPAINKTDVFLCQDNCITKFYLHLKTPLRIKRKGRLISRLTADSLRQILNLDSEDEIIISTKREEWIDFRRYSTRQKSVMRFGGLVGEYVIESRNPQIFQALKRWEIEGVGKLKTFGFGVTQVQEL